MEPQTAAPTWKIDLKCSSAALFILGRSDRC